MELTLLTVPDCPNTAAFEERLATALAEHPGAAAVHHRVIADEREAARAGMHESPTLLVNGADPFAAPGQVRARGEVSSALVVKLLDAETHRRADAEAALAGGSGAASR